jgi:hypothetical protein
LTESVPQYEHWLQNMTKQVASVHDEFTACVCVLFHFISTFSVSLTGRTGWPIWALDCSYNALMGPEVFSGVTLIKFIKVSIFPQNAKNPIDVARSQKMHERFPANFKKGSRICRAL